MENEAVYRERWMQLVRILDMHVEARGAPVRHSDGRVLRFSLETWDDGTSGCAVGCAMHDAWFQQQGLVPKSAGLGGCDCPTCRSMAPALRNMSFVTMGGDAAVWFFGITSPEFERMFCSSSYFAGLASPERVRQRVLMFMAVKGWVPAPDAPEIDRVTLGRWTTDATLPSMPSMQSIIGEIVGQMQAEVPAWLRIESPPPELETT